MTDIGVRLLPGDRAILVLGDRAVEDAPARAAPQIELDYLCHYPSLWAKRA